MSTLEHPEIEQLSAYVREPQMEEFRQLRLHLVSCHDCRQKVSMLANMQHNLPSIQADELADTLSSDEAFGRALDKQMIEQYIDGKLNETDQQHLSEMIANNGLAMKAAMHYASHSARMTRLAGNDSGDVTIQASTVRPARDKVSSAGIMAMLNRWLQHRYSNWLTIPATAALASFLSFMLVPYLNSIDGNSSIVAYQDNPVIQFKQRNELPGIGFFSNANKTTQPYKNVTIEEIDRTVFQITWPKVNNAVSYTMQLKIFQNGQQLLVGKISTSDTHTRFKRIKDDNGKRYTWKLMGETANGEVFSTKGGFVIKSKSD